MKKRAFSLAEIIISMSILMLAILPTLKINSKQINAIKKIEYSNSSSDFFVSLNNFLIAKNLFLEQDKVWEFKSYQEMKSSELFREFELLYYPKQNFILKISLKFENVNFSHSSLACNISNIDFFDSANNYNSKIIKFKD